jgi:signal transduction histidine kinase
MAETSGADGGLRTASRLWDLGQKALREGVVEVFLAGAILLISRGQADGRPIPLVLDLVMVAGAALSGRWLVPGAVVAGLGLTGWLFFPEELPTFGLIAVLVPVFTAISRGRFRLGLTLTCWYLPVMLLAIKDWISDTWVELAVNGLFLVLAFAITWLTGYLIGRERARLEVANRQHEERLAEQRRDLARDLHDTLAQTITGMVVTTEGIKHQLGGSSSPDVAQDLETVLRLGRQSITDLRGIMHILRTDAAGDRVVSAWRVASVPTVLAEQSAELERRGFSVSTLVDGDLESLPPSVRECLAKLIVEAASNMTKHATAGGPCSMTIEISPAAVEAVFTNPYQPRHVRPRTGGVGLVGAQERIEALAGELTVLESANLWTLRARIPVVAATGGNG